MPPRGQLRLEKSKKNKEKKQRKKEELASQAAALELVRKANEQESPMEALPAFRKFTRNGLNLVVECNRVGNLDEATHQWIFDLTRKNMQSMYEATDWGWDDANKREELMEECAWYLIARNSDNVPVAFSHFRFDMDCGDEVLYCYEIQLEEEVRRKGLGRFLLQILELLGFRANMRKVVLTVFRNNEGAYTFFRAQGYTLDETSPPDTLLTTYHYQILSKLNRKKTEA